MYVVQNAANSLKLLIRKRVMLHRDKIMNTIQARALSE